MKGTIKFIDLFAGIGGIRCGLELAAHEAGYKTECVFTSEIKKHAIKVLKQNHPNELINGDITQVNEKEIPDFDICCAGFMPIFFRRRKKIGLYRNTWYFVF